MNIWTKVSFPLSASTMFAIGLKANLVRAKEKNEEKQKTTMIKVVKLLKIVGAGLLADHPPLWGVRTIKSRSERRKSDVEQSYLVQTVKVIILFIRVIFGDHIAIPESVIKHKSPKKEEKDDLNDQNFIQRHSAKCAILTRKGDVLCTNTQALKDEVFSDQKCYKSKYLKRHDYDKIFDGSVETQKLGFKELKSMNYENRLRRYSNPDKIFRYFASLESFNEDNTFQKPLHDHVVKTHDFHSSFGKSKVFMNPEDFVRSLSPGSRQPEGLGLDSYRWFDPKDDMVICNLPPTSIFYQISSDGLINFADYLFLHMVLTHPIRHFRMAFNLFDNEGTGFIGIKSFRRIQRVLLSQTKMGFERRDHKEHSFNKKELKCQSAVHFFGQDLKKKMAIEDFISFQKKLKEEINSLEFDAYGPDRLDSIHALDFVDSLTKFMGLFPKDVVRIKKMKQNVTKYLKTMKQIEANFDIRISRKEFQDFNVFLCYPVLMKLAFESYHGAGIKISRSIFKSIAKQITGIDLSDNIVLIIYVMMGDMENDDLSQEAFRKIVMTRTTFGLRTNNENPTFSSKFFSMYNCLGNQYDAFIRVLSNKNFICDSICKK